MLHRVVAAGNMPAPPGNPARNWLAPVPVEQVDGAVPGVGRELAVGDPELAREALERVGVAGGDRDLREVTLGLAPRQRGLDRVEPQVLARGDVGQRELTAPLADLDHERHVRGRRQIGEREVAGLVGHRQRVRAAGEPVRAPIALGAWRQRPGIGDRHVDVHAVERQRAVGGEHLAGDAGRREPLRRAVDDEALEALARIGHVRGIDLQAAVLLASAGGERRDERRAQDHAAERVTNPHDRMISGSLRAGPHFSRRASMSICPFEGQASS